MKEQKSIRVFENPLLERLTHVHPITPLVLWVPIISWLLWRGANLHQIGAVEMGSAAVSGLFVWTLSEYLLHRYVFHFEPAGKLGKRIIFLIHGLHHAEPQDASRLVMPPVPGLILAASLFSIFRAILAPLTGPEWVEPFFGFFLIGYLWYDYTHFAVHHFTPRTRYGRMLKQHHMLHHYADPTTRYGVSSPLWDVVFRTLKSALKQPAKG